MGGEDFVRLGLFDNVMWCATRTIHRASGEESKSFVIVVVTKSSETFIEPTSPTIWCVVLNIINRPAIDVSGEIVYDFVATSLTPGFNSPIDLLLPSRFKSQSGLVLELYAEM